MSQNLRVGVLTGGGDCPGLNAVIRAVTKSLILKHNAQVIGFEDGFHGLIERRMRPLSYKDVSGILTRGGTILGTSNKANPFNYHDRGGADVSAQILKYCKDLGLQALITIGGDGTMSISHRLAQMGLNVVGVPKTIDNDLVGTDRTFGFDTAVGGGTHGGHPPTAYHGPEPQPGHDHRDDGTVCGMDCLVCRNGRWGRRHPDT